WLLLAACCLLLAACCLLLAACCLIDNSFKIGSCHPFRIVQTGEIVSGVWPGVGNGGKFTSYLEYR
ncbi:hypothetical protein KSS87_016391, partial [Heliosperma pusillum]